MAHHEDNSSQCDLPDVDGSCVEEMTPNFAPKVPMDALVFSILMHQNSEPLICQAQNVNSQGSVNVLFPS